MSGRASDRNELKSAFSNFGVDVVAGPGGAALVSCRTTGYDFYAGTSMATPHVAGVAALLTAQGRTGDQAIDVLESTARTPGAGARGAYTPVHGYGIVDAAAAVAAP